MKIVFLAIMLFLLPTLSFGQQSTNTSEQRYSKGDDSSGKSNGVVFKQINNNTSGDGVGTHCCKKFDGGKYSNCRKKSPGPVADSCKADEVDADCTAITDTTVECEKPKIGGSLSDSLKAPTYNLFFR